MVRTLPVTVTGILVGPDTDALLPIFPGVIVA